MSAGIYKIEHKESGKKYIGSSITLHNRLRTHKWGLKNNRHENAKLQNAWNAHGESEFDFAVLLICDKDNLQQYEQTVIILYDSVRQGYNICPQAGTCAGVSPSDETRRKLSLAGKGKIKPPMTSEQREKLAVANRGKKASPETKAKISQSRLGRKLSEFHCKRISETRKGMKFSDTHRKNMSKANLGKKLSEETKAKISAANKGRVTSPETRRLLSLANIGKTISAEQRLKISQKLKGRKQPSITDEKRAKLSAAAKRRVRRTATPEQRAKMSASHKAIWAARKQKMFNITINEHKPNG